MSGWRLETARSISADGKIIVGVGANPAGRKEAYLADLHPVPEPQSLFLAASAISLALLRLRIVRITPLPVAESPGGRR